MSQEKIQLIVTGGESAGMFGYRFAPGATITGQVALFPEQEVKCRRVTVSLQWRTEGRGTPASQIVAQTTLHEGDLIGLLPQQFPFSLIVPESPWSYDGHYIKIVWELIANVDIPWGSDWGATQAVVVEPEGR